MPIAEFTAAVEAAFQTHSLAPLERFRSPLAAGALDTALARFLISAATPGAKLMLASPRVSVAGANTTLSYDYIYTLRALSGETVCARGVFTLTLEDSLDRWLMKDMKTVITSRPAKAELDRLKLPMPDVDMSVIVESTTGAGK